MKISKIALIGNPNTGKTSIFNLLTGLRQHVGNFPGVTVDKRWGNTVMPDGSKIQVLDLPGTYSIYPRSKDERVVFDVLTNPKHEDFPDLFVVIADGSNLGRNLLLFTQLHDMKLPVILVLTMQDMAGGSENEVNAEALSATLNGVPVIWINGRTGDGIAALKEAIANYQLPAFKAIVENSDPISIGPDIKAQSADSTGRFAAIDKLLKEVSHTSAKIEVPGITKRLDHLLVHPLWGYMIFGVVLFSIFQVIFRIASYPMDWIEGTFINLSEMLRNALPEGPFTDLLAEGVIPGIGGVVVFIPQIALLFFLLAILEETGYMSRVVFIMDKLVRPFGLNGKSVVPLMSSVACAIPGIMATRSINSWKDRLVTIMVAPLMSCSARIPVYTLLIGLVVPEDRLFGFVDQRGLVLFLLYALGLFSALAIAAILKGFIKTGESGFLMLEMPAYRAPRWSAIGINLVEKVKVFILDAGKVILAVSVILWATASYGPQARIDKAIETAHQEQAVNPIPDEDFETKLEAVKLENSYIGIVGKSIEPVIRPLGYDWKIGIAIITSFAAREVFVGSMSTIYAVGRDNEDGEKLKEILAAETDHITGKKIYTTATGASLMIFYAFAMQCMATFAVVKRETKSWKWPLIQVFYMGVMAYLGAWITFLIFS